MDGKQRRLLIPLLIGISVLLLASCAPAVPETTEVCPTPVNLPLEDDTTEAAALPAVLAEPMGPEATAEAVTTPTPKASDSTSPKQASSPGTTVAVAPTAVPAVTAEDTAAAPTAEVEDLVAAGPPPQVVAHTPGDTAGVVWTQDIRILFSRPMDRASVEQAISVTPGDRTFTVSWHRDDTLIRLVPSAEWVGFEWYTVTVGASATAADGAPMGADYSFTFWGEEP